MKLFNRFKRIGKNAMGVDAVRGQNEYLAGKVKGIRHQWSLAIHAIRHQPQWDSIDDLERSWGIHDENRTKVMRSLKLEIALFGLLAALGVWNIVKGISLHYIVLYTLPGVLLVFLGVAKTILAAWRLDVLVSRRPINFVQWLRK